MNRTMPVYVNYILVVCLTFLVSRSGYAQSEYPSDGEVQDAEIVIEKERKLLNLGYEVSGSDLIPSEITQRLRERGLDFHSGHDAETIDGTGIVVISAAVSEENAEVREARRRGIPVYVETRPLYLHLTRARFDEPDGAKYSGAPPLREQVDVDAIWSGLRFGAIDTLATDHAPWTLAEKLDPELDATNLRQGVADLETCLPMLYSAGVRTGRLMA